MRDHADLPFGEACSPEPGLVIERRGFLATVAAAMAAVPLPGSSPAWRERVRRDDGFTVEEFVREVTPVCKELLADTSRTGQDRYLLALASHAVRLTDVPVPELRKLRDGYHLGSNHGPDPFTVLHWRLEPKAEITPHPHIYGNVVTLGLAGVARVRNYEVVGERDYDGTQPFQVQLSKEQFLRKGDVNLVSLERHYMHGFTAGSEGARGLDITTRIAPKRKSPVLVLGDVVDAGQRTFTATWQLGD